jgi:hypothetical protein
MIARRCLLILLVCGFTYGFTPRNRISISIPACAQRQASTFLSDAATTRVESANTTTRQLFSIEDVRSGEAGKESFLRKIFRRLSPFKGKSPEPGTLILVRHGDSVIRDELTFTGWIDVDISEEGSEQIKNAAKLIASEGYTIDVVYTSRLKRAIRSAWILMQELDQIYKPVYKVIMISICFTSSNNLFLFVQTCTRTHPVMAVERAHVWGPRGSVQACAQFRAW